MRSAVYFVTVVVSHVFHFPHLHSSDHGNNALNARAILAKKEWFCLGLFAESRPRRADMVAEEQVAGVRADAHIHRTLTVRGAGCIMHA